jgi:hypothetical protein
MRLDYAVAAPEPTKALAGVNAALLRGGSEQTSQRSSLSQSRAAVNKLVRN